MCSMKRRSAGFLEDEDRILTKYAHAGTEPNRALSRIVPEVEVDSVSSAIRALVLAGHRTLEAERLRRSYDDAVAAGELDDERAAWYRAVATTLAETWTRD
jgi:hypothetical protein